MSFWVRLLAIGFLTMLLSSASVFAQSNSLEIRGDVQRPRTWSIDDVKKYFADEIQTLNNVFARETLTGVPLISLIVFY